MLKKELLCTLGPSSMNERVITRLEDLNVNLLRINMSHTKVEDLPKIIDFIRSKTSVPICIDTEGAQVRTGNLAVSPVDLENNSIVTIVREKIAGNAKKFNFYPPNIIDEIQVNDLISIDFNSVITQVVDKQEDHIKLRVLNGEE